MEINHAPVSRPWLESLSTDELIKLADTYGIDIPVGLERIFIIEEILEISSLDEPKTTNDIEVNPSYSETALLPKQYNITYIEVLIRDPLWVFVFWEVKGNDKELYESAGDFNGYCLRIIPMDDAENSYTVSIGAEDNARYLGFADSASAEEKQKQDLSSYTIKLIALRGDSEITIASSPVFCMPKLYENESITAMSQNPLVRLSGAQDLQITKNTDRQARIKRQQ